MISYPASLPSPQENAYGYAGPDSVIRTTMMSGRLRQRRILQDAPAPVSLQWLLSRAQWAYFEYWHQDVLNAGSLSFSCPVRVGGLAQQSEVQLVSRYKVSGLNGPLISVTCDAQIVQLNRIDAVTASVLDAYSAQTGSADNYALFVDRLEILVNTELPANAAFDPVAA